MTEGVAAAVARCAVTRVSGAYYRHASLKYAALAGYPVGGRWAPPGAFPVIYFGRPLPSVIVEAYRHLVDSVEGMTRSHVAARQLLTCRIDVGEIVDLRDPESQQTLGLSHKTLYSEVGDYDACQRIGATAHQLGRKGLIAPAATGLGETLALFTSRITVAEMPVAIESEVWEQLPADPRRLRVIEGGGAGVS
jgi:RES domain-containing protein